jgi:acyl-CoA synthetase (AMP-forming)/AMP-acid ligase II
VAILAGKCHRVVETRLAATRTGTILVPIEPKWSAADVANVLIESNARALFVSMEFLPRLEHIGRQSREVDVLPVILTARPPLGLLSYERLLEVGELLPAQ